MNMKLGFSCVLSSALFCAQRNHQANARTHLMLWNFVALCLCSITFRTAAGLPAVRPYQFSPGHISSITEGSKYLLEVLTNRKRVD